MLNQITIMGRLVADPVLRRTASGVTATSFTLAVDRDYSRDGERDTDFIDCVAWRGTAEFVERYFSKGRMAVVSGRLQTRNWTDNDGNKRKSFDVVAESVYFADSKKADSPGRVDESNSAAYQPTSGGFSTLSDDDGDLPF